MRLIGFKIQNVKSIKDTGWCHLSDHDNITVFAGQNEAGKSAILEGLNFFRNGTDPEFERLSTRNDGVFPFVECEFQLEDGDWDSDPDVNSVVGKFGTIKMYRGDVSVADYAEIKISKETLDAINVEISKFIQHEEEELAQASNSEVPSASQDATSDATEPEPVPSAGPPTDPDGLRKEINQHFLNHLPEFIYYDSFKSYLPGTVKLSEIAASQAVKDFEQVFGISFEELISLKPQARQAKILKINNSATADLNEYWTQKLSNAIDDSDDKYQYSINFHLNEATPMESIVDFMIHRNDDTPLFIEQKSKGFQWFSAFNLRLKSLGVESKTVHKYLILIDEPGQGLHEKAQTNVKDVLEELQSKGMQILYTTHNPCLIGVSDQEILRIRLVYQTRPDGTKINNIAQYSSNNGSQDALSPIITAMGINSIGQILDRTIPCVVLEGITDHYYFTAMKKVLGAIEDYSFIPAVGVPNIKPLVSILIGWGANFKAVFDDGAGKKVYNDLSKYLYPNDPDALKSHILKMEGFDGIEDLFSSEDFDTHIVGSTRSDAGAQNSTIAKSKKKELLARLFLEKVNLHPETVQLSDETKTNFKKIFEWLKGEQTTTVLPTES
ncbi:MAG TPA: AAA family ATPase [Candidatus Levybacteria bacterium]|nr:AAA family ATPase [Candidatus Levybacteria bacterium]